MGRTEEQLAYDVAVLGQFPDRNPNPVMRVGTDGALLYANDASQPILASLRVAVGDSLPPALLADIQAAGADGRPLELTCGVLTFSLLPVSVPELGFSNVYGADVTAAKAITKFPDQNPHPVLRVAPDGTLLYANPAADLIRAAMGEAVGQVLPAELLATVRRIASEGSGETIELESGGRLFSLLVVSVFEYGFTNLYGTDITAAREVERAHAENERLLLNILPASIAERLRSGEGIIADRMEEMTVLFADIVDFSRLSIRLGPTELVDLLNGIFSVFDDLSDRYGLEKIKTIGDAYKVVGGLAPETSNH